MNFGHILGMTQPGRRSYACSGFRMARHRNLGMPCFIAELIVHLNLLCHVCHWREFRRAWSEIQNDSDRWCRFKMIQELGSPLMCSRIFGLR